MMQELWADAIGNMDSDLVELFVLMEQGLAEKKPVKVIAWKKWSLIAASLLLAVGIGSSAAFHFLSSGEPVNEPPVFKEPVQEENDGASSGDGIYDELMDPINVNYSYEEYLDFLTDRRGLAYKNGFVTYERVCFLGEFDHMNYWTYDPTGGVRITYFLNDRGRPIELLIQNYRNSSALPKQEITDAVFDSCDMRKIISTNQYQFDESDKVGGCYYRMGDTYYIYDDTLSLQKIMICSQVKQYTLTLSDLSNYPMSGENAVIHNLLDREKAYAQIEVLLTLWEAK